MELAFQGPLIGVGLVWSENSKCFVALRTAGENP
jgi:hypothetical protein